LFHSWLLVLLRSFEPVLVFLEDGRLFFVSLVVTDHHLFLSHWPCSCRAVLLPCFVASCSLCVQGHAHSLSGAEQACCTLPLVPAFCYEYKLATSFFFPSSLVTSHVQGDGSWCAEHPPLCPWKNESVHQFWEPS
jgi:hypothetical protein